MTNFIAGKKYALRSLHEAIAKIDSSRKTPECVDHKDHDVPTQGSIANDAKDRKTDWNSAPTDLEPINDFVSPQYDPDDEYVYLYVGELEGWTQRFSEIVDIQGSNAENLKWLAKELLFIRETGAPTPEEINDLCEFAIELATDAEDVETMLTEAVDALDVWWNRQPKKHTGKLLGCA